MVTRTSQISSASISSEQTVRAKPRRKNPYETSHFKSVSFHVHEQVDPRLLSLRRNTFGNKPGKETRTSFDSPSAEANGKRKYTPLPAGSVKKPALPIDTTATHQRHLPPNEIHYPSAPLPAPSEISPILTYSLPAVQHLGFKPSLTRLNFDTIVTIAKQSLEFLAQMPGVVNLRPSFLNFEPDSRCLTVLMDNQNDNVQLITSPFYQCPEALLEGTIDRLADVWSLGCILFELLTNEPLFVMDPSMHPNVLLHQMALQIGMPTKQFLQQCRGSERYFILEPEVQLRQNLLISSFFWKDRILLAGRSKGIAQEKINGFIQLLTQMLAYENRCPPQILLNNPLFQDDVRFYLFGFTPADKISIYRNSEMEARLYDGSTQPLSVAHVDGSNLPPQTYLYMPRDPLDQYVVFVERNGIRLIPECLLLKDGAIFFFPEPEMQTPTTTLPA